MIATPQEIRSAWGLVPADCKWALTRLKSNPEEWAKARPVILAEAEAGLKLLGRTFSNLDVMVSLEIAAEHYLKDRGLA